MRSWQIKIKQRREQNSRTSRKNRLIIVARQLAHTIWHRKRSTSGPRTVQNFRETSGKIPRARDDVVSESVCVSVSVGVFLVEARKIHEEIRAHHIIIFVEECGVSGWVGLSRWGPSEKGGGCRKTGLYIIGKTCIFP
uniref:(northern house mosquito) hypothetical protein n=1 Tax=Culex pipiens TaxID=7175 RepID=A0A8D8BDW2_CULPI